MTQHEYRQFTEANVEAALRVLERRESEGWEFASMFPKPHGLLTPGRDFEVVVIIRRPADTAKPAE
jgi:hypothetical protein